MRDAALGQQHIERHQQIQIQPVQNHGRTVIDAESLGIILYNDTLAPPYDTAEMDWRAGAANYA
jgi:hypothetical protein